MSRLEKRLLNLVGRASKDFTLIEPNDRILVAVSGGKDSYAMLHLLRRVQQRVPFDLSLVAVNLDDGSSRVLVTERQSTWQRNAPIHRVLDDGRFMVLIFGLGRVHLDEISSDEPYRLVKATRLEEAEAAGATEERLLEALKAAVAERSSSEDETFPDLPLAVATDLLAVRLKVPQLVMQEIFAEADVARRAELALAAHAKYPGS